jgi:glycine oxidase
VKLRVVVVGAGIVGSSIAWELKQAGIEAILLDPGPPPGQGSGAGAGMLSPGAEVTGRSGWSTLALESANAYASFVARLQAALPEADPIDYRQCGAVELAWDDDEAGELHRRIEAQSALGIGSRWLLPRELSLLVPALTGVPRAALYYPRDAIVNARDVVRLLHTVCPPVPTPVEAIEATGSGATVHTPSGTIPAGAAVVAAGAWSSSIRVRIGEAPLAAPKAVPVRGHLLGFRVSPGSLGPILRHHHTYLLQRRSGLLIAGTSEERVGFDAGKDEAVIADIHRRASRLIPSLIDSRPFDSWIGFRPGIEAEAPAIGLVPGSRLWLAYGHYRNGILLAPATASKVAREVAAALGA